MRVYLINFWVWWYGVKTKEWMLRAYRWALFVLQYTNTLTMAKNLTVPLFQDQSSSGRFLALIIRSVWVWLGGMLSIFVTIPVFIFYILVALLPLIVIVQIGQGVVRIIL